MTKNEEAARLGVAMAELRTIADEEHMYLDPIYPDEGEHKGQWKVMSPDGLYAGGETEIEAIANARTIALEFIVPSVAVSMMAESVKDWSREDLVDRCTDSRYEELEAMDEDEVIKMAQDYFNEPR